MADKTTIRVIQAGQERAYNYSALIGEFFDRITKQHGHVEIADPELEEKLSTDELKRLYLKFPHLNPGRDLPPQPKAQKVEFRKEPTIETLPSTSDSEVVNFGVDAAAGNFESMGVPELKAYLTDNGIKFDGRKKVKDYFVELAKAK